mmetsp:Transcript_133806/g.198987  ORF Transcript_133806/g.198987 Transcript_133806/m.198987 type:complete len:157 (-) Transcript_133806:20-490(-)
MAYGTSSLDLGKIVVLVSSIFNVVMVYLIATDPAGVIASPHGGGWWDPLKASSASVEHTNTGATHIYPRIWASYLVFQVVVRVNWVFTVETAPSLYRCVLMSYMLPYVQYCMECMVFETLPSFGISDAAFMMIPWLAIVVGYSKYTEEGDHGRKKD